MGLFEPFLAYFEGSGATLILNGAYFEPSWASFGKSWVPGAHLGSYLAYFEALWPILSSFMHILRVRGLLLAFWGIFLGIELAVFQIKPVLLPEADKRTYGQTKVGSSPLCRMGLLS